MNMVLLIVNLERLLYDKYLNTVKIIVVPPPLARMRGNFFEGGGLDYGKKKAILE